jgi:hypothetical protein
VPADGGVSSLDARFLGAATALRLGAPVVAIGATTGPTGYRLVSDDGVFDYRVARLPALSPARRSARQCPPWPLGRQPAATG